MDYGFVLWGPTLLALVLKVPAIQAAKMFIFVSISAIIGKFIWAYLSEALGRRVGGMMIGIGIDDHVLDRGPITSIPIGERCPSSIPAFHRRLCLYQWRVVDYRTVLD